MILNCPRCGVKHVQTAQVVVAHDRVSDASVTWHVQRCQNPSCTRLLVVVQRQDGGIDQQWPAASYELDSDLVVTSQLRDDYREAGLCLDAGCFKASLVMSRRGLQRILKDKGCTQRNLGGEDGAIAVAIKGGILREPLHALATEVKEYGNLGAHPDDDQLESASKESAAHVLGFLRLIVDEFYGVPMTAEKLRRRRTGQ